MLRPLIRSATFGPDVYVIMSLVYLVNAVGHMALRAIFYMPIITLMIYLLNLLMMEMRYIGLRSAESVLFPFLIL